VAPQHRTQLGRVLVTIDDLAALMTILNESGGDNTRVEFDGGYITDAKELRELTDIELRSIRLKNSKVEVVLSRMEAFAVGEFQEAENIYMAWARARQTRLKPHPFAFANSKSTLYFLLIMYTLFIPVSILSIVVAQPSHKDILIFSLMIPFSASVIYTSWRELKRRDYSAAVIIPLSLDEHRQTRANQTYPRRSWIVAMIAAIIAALAVAAAVWIKLTSVK
jgi:hypothetical protein